MIKVDRSLIANIDIDEKKQVYYKQLISDMHNRTIVVLAEGIETKEVYSPALRLC